MSPRSTALRTAPFLLMAAGAAMIVAPAFRPPADHDLGPFDLIAGAERTAEFTANYSELYAIGLRMDQRKAKVLAPSLVDPSAFCLFDTACPKWPASLALKLTSGGTDLTTTVEPSGGSAGGAYAGSDSYTWEAAFVHLSRGARYRLRARSMTDASELQRADPRLVVSVASPGFFDRQAVTGLAAVVCGGILLLCGLSWAAIDWLRSRGVKRWPRPDVRSAAAQLAMRTSRRLPGSAPPAQLA